MSFSKYSPYLEFYLPDVNIARAVQHVSVGTTVAAVEHDAGLMSGNGTCAQRDELTDALRTRGLCDCGMRPAAYMGEPAKIHAAHTVCGAER